MIMVYTLQRMNPFYLTWAALLATPKYLFKLLQYYLRVARNLGHGTEAMLRRVAVV